VLKDSLDKINIFNAQIQHTQELEILDLFHKSQAMVYQAIQSREMNEFFASKTETEELYRKKLIVYLNSLSRDVPFQSIHWLVLGSRGNLLLSTDTKKNMESMDISNLNGAYYEPIGGDILLSLPLYFNDNVSKKIYAYVSIKIPLQSLKKKYPYLVSIQSLPSDLSALKFKGEFQIPSKNTHLIYLFYFYIAVFIVFNLFAVFFGIQLLQEKIVNKLKQLTLRVANDIHFSSQLNFNHLIHITKTKNEIDSLSSIFYKYMKYVQFLQYEIEKSSQLAAVGHIAHTIAHDLRKPFSSSTMFLEQLEQIQTREDALELTHDFKPILKHSIEYVEHLLSEIMEAGVNQLQLSPQVKLEEILNKSFSNILALPNECQVEFEYNFNLNSYLHVDELRLLRIFSNMILNALEAMNYKGKIWIHASKQHGHEFAEIILGNTNSYIEEQDIKHLFEPFYTKNKKNGTGLGLSISQKIIQLHGGKISCRSYPNRVVEFVFTLPLGHSGYKADTSKLPKELPQIKTITEKNSLEQQLHKEGVDHREIGNTILLIDDDPFVAKSWVRGVKDANVYGFLSPQACVEKIRLQNSLLNHKTIVVTDFNFGLNVKMDFYEFIIELRKVFLGPIFLSTDALEEDVDQTFLAKHGIKKIKKSIYSFIDLTSENK
jgi:signal transduction histidine kinase